MLSCVWLFATFNSSWAYGLSPAKLLLLPFPSPRDLVNPGIKPSSPALAGGFSSSVAGAAPAGLLAIKPPLPSAASSGSNSAFVYLPLTKQLSITHRNAPSNLLKRHGERQKSHMKMFNTINSTLSPHFNISEVEVFKNWQFLKIFIWLLQVSVVACGIFSWGMWDVVPSSGIKTWPPALGARSLNHWITTGSPPSSFFLFLVAQT